MACYPFEDLEFRVSDDQLDTRCYGKAELAPSPPPPPARPIIPQTKRNKDLDSHHTYIYGQTEYLEQPGQTKGHNSHKRDS